MKLTADWEIGRSTLLVSVEAAFAGEATCRP